MTPIIKTEGLCHKYSVGTPFERTAIDDVNFEASAGEFIGVIGHTGSGKSTFIQHLNGLLKPSSGKVYYEGTDIWESKETTKNTRFKVGLVFQYPEYQLFEETVYKDIAFGPRNMAISEEEVDMRVREAADFVGLDSSFLDKSPFDLSGGQKRRVAIAGVIAMGPSVLILDEPGAGLDPRGRESIIENIKSYHEATDATVIMVTHSMEEIATTVDRIVVFNQGRLAMGGTPREVFSRGDELTEMGLSVPEVTRIAKRLKELGLPVDPSVYTIDQLKDILVSLKKGGGRNA